MMFIIEILAVFSLLLYFSPYLYADKMGVLNEIIFPLYLLAVKLG